MSCPKRLVKYKFLWWEYEVELEHDWKVVKIEKLYLGYDNKIIYKCDYCGCVSETNWLDDEEILRRFGFLFTYADGNHTLYRKEIEKQIEENKELNSK